MVEYQEGGGAQSGAKGPESERGLRAQSSRGPNTLALWVLTLEVGETALVLLWGDWEPHVEGGETPEDSIPSPSSLPPFGPFGPLWPLVPLVSHAPKQGHPTENSQPGGAASSSSGGQIGCRVPTLTSARLLWGSHFAASVLCLNGAGHIGVSMLSVMGVWLVAVLKGLVDAHGSPFVPRSLPRQHGQSFPATGE